jgi:hypothetical protein
MRCSEADLNAQMIRGYRDKEFRDHLTGQEAIDVEEYDRWKLNREDLEYSLQFMKNAEEARHGI